MTAIVLCMAPMALMVGAAEHLIEIHFLTRDVTCSHDPNNYILSGGILDESADDDYVWHWYYCKRIWYRNGNAYCPVCQSNYTVDYSILISHPSFLQNPANGRYYCSDCHMEKQN